MSSVSTMSAKTAPRMQGRPSALRSNATIELSPSANHVSARVLELQAAALASQCNDGCSGITACARCQAARIDECVAIDRVQRLFDAAYANVQPHSAAQAAALVYRALLADGDTVLDLTRAGGGQGERTHQAAADGKTFKTVRYRLNSHSGEIDEDKLRALARMHRPRMIAARFPDVFRAVNMSKLREIADQIGAYLYIDITQVAALIATGLYPNPIAITDIMTSATDGALRGPPGGVILARPNPGIEAKISATVAAGAMREPDKTLIAAKAQAFREALDPRFVAYQCQVIANARAMLDVFVARSYRTIGNGEHDASFVVDLADRGFSGEQAAALLTRTGIRVAGAPPCTAAGGGIRIGASAITTQGFAVPQAESVARLICDALDRTGDRAMLVRVRQEVTRLCRDHSVRT